MFTKIGDPPQNTRILILGTPKKGTPVFGNPLWRKTRWTQNPFQSLGVRMGFASAFTFQELDRASRLGPVSTMRDAEFWGGGGGGGGEGDVSGLGA